MSSHPVSPAVFHGSVSHAPLDGARASPEWALFAQAAIVWPELAALDLGDDPPSAIRRHLRLLRGQAVIDAAAALADWRAASDAHRVVMRCRARDAAARLRIARGLSWEATLLDRARHDWVPRVPAEVVDPDALADARDAGDVDADGNFIPYPRYRSV